MLAGDLNESHIGQRFKFEGTPRVEGELSGILVGYRDEIKVKIVNSVADGNLWAQGYYINAFNTVIPLEPLPVVDSVKARLAEYIATEYHKRMGISIVGAGSKHMADIFMELMEGGTDANGEG